MSLLTSPVWEGSHALYRRDKMPQEPGKLTYPVRFVDINPGDIPSTVTSLMLFLKRQEDRGWEIKDVVMYPTMRKSLGEIFVINYLRINVIRHKEETLRTETRRYYSSFDSTWKAV